MGRGELQQYRDIILLQQKRDIILFNARTLYFLSTFMFVCIYVKHSKTNISILCIFSMYAKDDNKDNNKINNNNQ